MNLYVWSDYVHIRKSVRLRVCAPLCAFVPVCLSVFVCLCTRMCLCMGGGMKAIKNMNTVDVVAFLYSNFGKPFPGVISFYLNLVKPMSAWGRPG